MFARASTWRIHAGTWLLLAVAYELLGWPTAAAALALCAAGAIIAATVLQLIHNRNERKDPHGRYREAAEAYRARADRGAGNRAGRRAGRAARAGAGAGMTDPFQQHMRDIAARIAGGIHGPVYIGGPGPNGVTGPVGTPALSHTSRAVSRPNRQSNANDFEGVGYAAGVVTGTRSFALDKLGRLTGVAYKVVWKPGENEARCMARDVDMYMGSMGATRFTDVVRPADRPEHSIADCEHGFYGYYDGSNDYYEPGRIMAVVEGYGDTIIGTRGFRASKARIVALHLPDGLGVRERRLVARNYPAIPTFESFDAMVAEFPPDDAGQGINPESDPTFWTREA